VQTYEQAVYEQPALGWTVVLRRRPVRTVEGRVQGGYTNTFEIICCDCGDHPDRDYRDVSPRLRRIRGPYPIAAGIAAYEEHLKLHHRPVQPARGGQACAGGG
jgi:hypothetical protein